MYMEGPGRHVNNAVALQRVRRRACRREYQHVRPRVRQRVRHVHVSVCFSGYVCVTVCVGIMACACNHSIRVRGLQVYDRCVCVSGT